MAINRTAALLFIATAILAASAYFASADLGMVAGPLNFNVSVGGHETLQFRAFNSGSQPILFNVVPPTFTAIANQSTPSVTITPSNGTIAPHSELTFNVTVNVPGKDRQGDFWDNIIQVVELSNVTNTNGATVLEGVGKEISITSAPAKTDYPLIIGSIIAAALIICASALHLNRRRRRSPEARAAPAKGAAAVSRPGGRTSQSRRRTRKRAASSKTPGRRGRKTKARPSTTGKKTARRRRRPAR